MITPSFGLTATERVLPKLALDFTTASLDSRITFTRALNTATRVNSSGYVESVNADTPRFDYDPITKVCKGLLIEETRVNNCLYSEEFDVSPTWVVSNSTVSTNATTAPSNSLTADKLIEDTATAEHAVTQSISYPANNAITLSLYAKTSGRNLRILMSDNLTGVAFAVYDLTNGTFSGQTISGSWTAISSTITNVGNGWYRCTLTATKGGGTTVSSVLTLNDGTTTSYTGDGASGVFLWGAQLEAGAFPTSYIPTTTTSLTRNADVATMTGTNFSDWFNATEGTFAAQIINFDNVSSDKTLFCTDDGNTTQAEENAVRITSAGTVYLNRIRTLATTVSTLGGSSVPIGNVARICGAYKLDSFAASVIGSATQTDNLGGVPVGQQRMQIGTRANGASTATMLLQKIYYWPQRLTNAEVQAFSKEG